MNHDVIAIIFDFDDTLAPESTSGFLDSLGVDVPEFWQQTEVLRSNGWDPVPAYLYNMINISKAHPITRETLSRWGQNIRLYPGVPDLFDKLKARRDELCPEIKLEFYVISSGIEEIIRSSPIADHFTDVWGCDFHYDEAGGIAFPKRIVSFTDKTRYIFHISKGLVGLKSRSAPFEVNRKVSAQEKRVPRDQMIFVGDGYTDVPCFSLIGKAGGIPLAVCDTEDRMKWGRAWGFMEEKRVIHWATADYRQGSTLYASLMMALESQIQKILVRERAYLP